MSEEIKIKGKSGKGKVVAIIMAAVVIVAVAVVALFILPKSAEAKKLTEKLDLGAKYLAELNYEQAEVEYLAAIEIDPKSEDAYLGLAEVYIATGELTKAKEVLEEGLREAEDTSEIIRLLEQVCQELGVPMPEIGNSTSGNGDSGYDENLVNPDFPESTAPAFSASTAMTGNKVVFGSYEQDNIAENGPEAIEWIVLDVQGENALLISAYCLDGRNFGTTEENISWGHSGLRAWLNDEFYNAAFTEEEKLLIVPQEISVDFFVNGGDDPLYDTYEPGYDMVSLLTDWQAGDLFVDDSGMQEWWISKARAAKPTQYAIAQGVYAMDRADELLEEENWCNGYCDWYLRAEIWEGARACYVGHSGIVCEEADDGAVRRLTADWMGIRPCISVKVE